MLGLLFACGPALLPPPPSPTAGSAPTATTATTADTGSVAAPPCGEVGGAPVCLSEVVSDDDSTRPTAPGEFPDWIEVVNVGSAPLDPARLLLVVGDAPSVAVSGPPVPPGGVATFTAVVADDGEPVSVYLDGVLADRWEVPPLAGDTSLVRPPGGGEPVVGCAPTPGAPNPPPAPCVDPRDALFARGHVVDLHLYVGDEGKAVLQSSQLLTSYPEVPARLGFDTPAGPGEFPAVGLSLKGGYGSFRTDFASQKPAFKVDLDAFEPRRFRGLDKLQLNNCVQDQTFVREYLTYTVFRRVGVPAPRVAWARVWVDDVYFGLYTLVEPVDDDFLELWFGDGSGHLLEGAYGPDFDPGEENAFEYDGGPSEVDGRATIAEVATLLSSSPRDEATYASLRALVDVDEWMTNLAVEAAVWHWDGYWTENNYYVYEDPGTGRLSIVPHGADQTWTDGWPNAWDPSGAPAIYDFCLAVPSCAAMYEQRVLEVADAIEALALEPVLDELLAVTGPEFDADPRIENRCCRQQFADSTRLRIQTVAQSLRDLAAAH